MQQRTGHNGDVNAVTAAELNGRPVIISGSSDRTVRAWESDQAFQIGDGAAGLVRLRVAESDDGDGGEAEADADPDDEERRGQRPEADRGKVLAWRWTTSSGSWPARGASRSAFRAR
jgi:hypothetical protein